MAAGATSLDTTEKARSRGPPKTSQMLLDGSWASPGALLGLFGGQSGFRTILGGFWDPRTMKKHEKVLNCLQKNKVFTIFAWSLQKERKKLTKPSPERPQGPQKRPRRRQERSRRAPRAPRERPRSRQEAPENRSKRTFAAGEPQERPGEAQEPPQRGPGSDFGASRASFGSFLGAPGTSFLSFFGAVQGRCACSHYVPQMLGRRVPR